MRKKALILAALAIVVILFGAWARSSMKKASENPQAKGYFPKPDKIVVYKEGKTQTLTVSDKLFSDIFTNMNGRVTNRGKLSTAALAISTEDMEAMKKSEIVVEFQYSKSAKITVQSQKIEVYNLIFPLTGKLFDLCFFDQKLNHYSGPIGTLDNIGDVLGLVK